MLLSEEFSNSRRSMDHSTVSATRRCTDMPVRFSHTLLPLMAVHIVTLGLSACDDRTDISIQ